jgi:hypothetical protein
MRRLVGLEHLGFELREEHAALLERGKRSGNVCAGVMRWCWHVVRRKLDREGRDFSLSRRPPSRATIGYERSTFAPRPDYLSNARRTVSLGIVGPWWEGKLRDLHYGSTGA